MAHSPRRSPGPLTHTETVTRQVCSSQSLPKHTYRGNVHRKGRRGAGPEPTSLHNFLDVQPEQNQSRQDLEGAADGRTQERQTAGAGERNGRQQDSGRGQTAGLGRSDRRQDPGAADGSRAAFYVFSSRDPTQTMGTEQFIEYAL